MFGWLRKWREKSRKRQEIAGRLREVKIEMSKRYSEMIAAQCVLERANIKVQAARTIEELNTTRAVFDKKYEEVTSIIDEYDKLKGEKYLLEQGVLP